MTKSHFMTERAGVPHQKGRFYISPMLPILLAVFVWIDCSVYTLLGAAAVVLHEAAHLIAIAICKGKIRRVALLPGGADISLAGDMLSYKKTIAVSLAGVAMNAALLAASIAFFPDPRAVFAAVSNGALLALNILPIRGLDGGEALLALLCLRSEPRKCEKILRITTLICMFPLSVFAIYIVVRTGYNLSLILVMIQLIINR